MENYNSDEDAAKILIESGQWATNTATDIIKKYKECKTVEEQNKLLPQLEYIAKKLAFEKSQIEKILEI